MACVQMVRYGPHPLSALLVVLILTHLALVPKLGHILPPLPGHPTLVGQLEHAQLPQVFLHNYPQSARQRAQVNQLRQEQAALL